MREYRLYPVASTGHVVGPAHIITCENDQEALQTAQSLVNGRDLEVWEGARTVGKIPSRPQMAPPVERANP
jgi:hypothetical protein